MIKAAIFDMDGVLIDSVQAGLRVRKKLLAGYGVDLDALPDPQGEGHRAASLKTLLINIENHHGLRIDPDEFSKISLEHMYKELHGESADPELIVFLKDLRKHDVACAIASSSVREAINNKLKILGIREYFSVIVTGSDVHEHKPHPASYLYAMEQLGLSPEDCVIFEDSLTGVQAGRASGCKVIGFAGFQTYQEPLPGTVMTVQKWSEVSFGTLAHL